MQQASERQLTGGCICGAVRYEVTGPFRPVVACHCRECQVSTGHYVAATQAYLANFRLIAEDGLKWYRSSDFAARGFCGECGSNLFFQRDNYDRIAIMAGSIDPPTGLAMAEQIWTSEAGDYYTPHPDVPARTGDGISPEFELKPLDRE